MRLEYRYDQAEKPPFFEGHATTNASGNFIPNARHQDTVTVGAVA